MPINFATCSSVKDSLGYILALTGEGLDPLARYWLVCPHPAMMRWVSRQIADQRGICAQLEMCSSARLYQELHQLAWGRAPTEPSVAQLTWATLDVAPVLAYQDPRAASLKRTFPGGAQGERLNREGASALPGSRFLAAQGIAETVQRLLAYRPHWLSAWSEGSDEVPEGCPTWWPALWRALKQRLGYQLREDAVSQTCERLRGMAHEVSAAMSHVIVLGRSQYDGQSLSLMKTLSELTSISCISLDPSCASEEASAQLWAGPELPADLGLRSPFTQAVGALWGAHLSRLDLSYGASTRGLPEPRHPLHLPAQPPPRPLSPETSAEQGAPSLLEQLCAALRRGEPLPTQAAPIQLSERSARSIQLHSCHSELRQVEALYQSLSAAMRRRPSLRPRDVLVLCADIERFVPLIEAVFHGQDGRLGAEISRPHGLNPFTDLLLQLLSLSMGRAYRYDVFQLLKLPLVSARFKLELADILALEAWLKRSGVRWGLDGAHRARFGLPEEELNTWSFGLERLLMGALVGDDVSLFRGVSPSPLGDGEELLARFLDFFVVLKELITQLSQPATPKAWTESLIRAARCLTRPDEESRWLLQELDSDLYHSLRKSAGERPLSPQAVVRALEGGLGRKPMLTGGGRDLVRFYPLDQAYGVPAQLICLLDMSDGRFPVPVSNSRLDPISLSPLPTDRFRSFEQLSQLGVTLFAAEAELQVFYTGRNPVGEPLEPSPVIQALQEELRGRYRLEGGASLLERLTTRHPLHPFSPRNFEGDEEGNPTEETLSHDPLWLEGAKVWREAQRNPKPRPPFAIGGVEEPRRGVKNARVDLLNQLLKNPSEFFLKRGVGMSLLKDEVGTRERELLELDGLQSWSLRNRTLQLALALVEEDRELSEEVSYVFERVRAEGLLPAGKMGVVSFEQSFEGVAALVQRFKEARGDKQRTPLALSLSLPSGRSVRVEHDALFQDKLIFTTPSKHMRGESPQGKRLLEPWLYHVAMSASGRDYEGASLVAADGSFERFPQLERRDAQALLDGWIEGLEHGLTRPLRFDPDLSWRFLEGRRAGDPLKSLHDGWTYSHLKEDLYAQRTFEGGVIWGDSDEVAPEFESAAELYFGPLERALNEAPPTPLEELTAAVKGEGA